MCILWLRLELWEGILLYLKYKQFPFQDNSTKRNSNIGTNLPNLLRGISKAGCQFLFFSRPSHGTKNVGWERGNQCIRFKCVVRISHLCKFLVPLGAARGDLLHTPSFGQRAAATHAQIGLSGIDDTPCKMGSSSSWSLALWWLSSSLSIRTSNNPELYLKSRAKSQIMFPQLLNRVFYCSKLWNTQIEVCSRLHLAFQ